MASAEPLFNPVFISTDVQRQLKPGFVVRPLQLTDYDKGFCETLSQLTTVDGLTKADFVERFAYMRAHNYEYFVIVIEDTSKGRIVGSGTIFVERKFVHRNGLVGHIEDIVTDKNYRGLNLGKLVIDTLKHIGKATGCYKVILDCNQNNIPFYEKCGFKHKEFEMAWYIDAPAAPSSSL